VWAVFFVIVGGACSSNNIDLKVRSGPAARLAA